MAIAWIFLRNRIRHKRASEAQAREENAQAERIAAREAARKAHDDEMRNRRFACDCRMLAMTRVGLAASGTLPDPVLPNADVRHVEIEADSLAGATLIERLAPAIDDALSAMYSTCRASLAFPVYVAPPAGIPGEEVLLHVRAVQSSCAAGLAPEMGRAAALSPIRFLPYGDSVPASILSLFESAPDLPGAVLLAFDSPQARISADGDFDDEPDAATLAHERLAGKPSEAVVALMVTSTALPSMLADLAQGTDADAADSMTPFWERAIHAGAGLDILSRAAPAIREELAALPVLGRIHRATVRHATGRPGVLELTRVVQDALEQAQINAGLIDPPFAFDDAPGEAAAKASPPAACAAIVHNAGSIDAAGKRLAALGSALYYFNIDLNPVDDETVLNIVTRIGDTGRARGIAQLAFTLLYAAKNAAPALCAEFMQDDCIAASFVMPAAVDT